jgi:hypothetical protein
MNHVSTRWVTALLAVAAITTMATAVPSAQFISAGTSLSNGSSVTSSNGNYQLKVSYDSVPSSMLVAYVQVGVPGSIWHSFNDANMSSGYGNHTNQWCNISSTLGFAVMQYDGNFVLYGSGGVVACWATNTQNNANAYGNVQDDANFVIYSSGGSPLWSIW